jgi:hypothetical protein
MIKMLLYFLRSVVSFEFMADLHDRITSAIARMGEDEDVAEESLTFEFVQLFCLISLKVSVSPQLQDPEGAPAMISSALLMRLRLI